MSLTVNVVIPTYNRAHLLGGCVAAALGQSHDATTVTVVDDGSTDDTGAALAPFLGNPRFSLVRLSRNLGAANAKNVGVLLSAASAVTFHDSDDLPHRDKVLRQARILASSGVTADTCLNWALASRDPGANIEVGVVLAHHEIILPSGERVEVRRALSLVDDFFPNLQMAAGPPGDWTHVNSGLFRQSVFTRLGGFADCVEEDREFRNRLIMAGEVIWVIPEILLTKIESTDSLTSAAGTNYASARRAEDRRKVWGLVEEWLRSRTVAPVPIDLPDDAISEISNTSFLGLGSAMATPRTRALAERALGDCPRRAA